MKCMKKRKESRMSDMFASNSIDCYCFLEKMFPNGNLMAMFEYITLNMYSRSLNNVISFNVISL